MSAVLWQKTQTLPSMCSQSWQRIATGVSAGMRQKTPNTPADVLTELAKDSDYDVRRYAACNPKLKEVLTDKK